LINHPASAFITMFVTLLITCLLTATSSYAAASINTSSPRIATRDIAGISVIDTPLVRAAEHFSKEHSSEPVYKHVMRSWLYGVLMINANSTLAAAVDLEVHAVASLLHDLGWDQAQDSTVVSHDRRFEVDGAIAARNFIEARHDGQNWEERRVQLVWDAIALHTERSIAFYKELDVQVVSKGIQMDFAGPLYGVPEDDYLPVEQAFPKDDLKDAVNQTFIWLCQEKPATTYDNWLQPWGDNHVPGYTAHGARRYDTIFANL
jgi:hypothetical protein